MRWKVKIGTLNSFDTEVPIRYYEYATVKMLFMLIEEGIVKNKLKDKI
jgi:hypothetical protein